MKARKRRSPDGTGLRERNYSTSREILPPTAPPRKRYIVTVTAGERVTEWSRYATRAEAEAIAAKLRQNCAFVATVTEEAPR